MCSLDSGSVLVVNHRLIAPEPKRQLPIGTRLEVLHTAQRSHFSSRLVAPRSRRRGSDARGLVAAARCGHRAPGRRPRQSTENPHLDRAGQAASFRSTSRRIG